MSRTLFLLILALFPIALNALPRSIGQAIEAFEQGNLQEARTLLDTAAQDPTAQTWPCTWYYRGVVYEGLLRKYIATEEALDWHIQALEAYQHVLSMTSPHTQYHSFAQANLAGLETYYLDRGRRYYRGENFMQAMGQFAIVKAMKPQAPQAYLYAGIAAQQDEDYALAWQNYTEYLSLGASHPAVHRSMAHIAFVQRHNAAQAQSILDQALAQYPWDQGLLHEQVQQCIALDKVTAWATLLQQKMAESPEAAIYPYYLGYVHEQQGQHTQALTYYQQASALAPKAAAPWQQQGFIHYQRAARCAQAMDQVTEEAFQQVGKALLDEYKTHLEQAQRCLAHAAERQPGDLLLLTYLHQVYDRLQQPTQAKAIQRQIQRLKR